MIQRQYFFLEGEVTLVEIRYFQIVIFSVKNRLRSKMIYPSREIKILRENDFKRLPTVVTRLIVYPRTFEYYIIVNIIHN